MTNHQSSPAAAGTGFLSAIRRFIELRFGLGFLATITLWAALTRFAPAALIANAMRLETFLQFTVVRDCKSPGRYLRSFALASPL